MFSRRELVADREQLVRSDRPKVDSGLVVCLARCRECYDMLCFLAPLIIRVTELNSPLGTGGSGLSPECLQEWAMV